MKSLFSFLLLIHFAVTATAQKVNFVYLETENASPFYLKMDDKVYSSTQSGYLILPNLVDSIYNFSIGFPSGNVVAKFKIPVATNDRGFLIKTFDYGLGLFDFQTTAEIKSETDDWQKNISYQFRDDAFTSLLAKASNDTSLFYVQIALKQDVAIQKNEPKVEEVIEKVIEPVKIDSAIITTPQTDIVIETKKPETREEVITKIDSIANYLKDSLDLIHTVTTISKDALVANVKDSLTQNTVVQTSIPDTLIIEKPVKDYKRSTVSRQSESSTSEGFSLVFFDSNENGVDTIRLIIPNQKIMINQSDTIQFENGLLEITKDTQQQIFPAIEIKKSLPKFDCPSFAGENDFFKLRKNMAAKQTDDAMVEEAKKFFKSKCFTTEQIKNLGTLFLTSAGKYQFFDAAYFHVSDQEVFPSLQTEIKDEYYLKRFKALIGE